MRRTVHNVLATRASSAVALRSALTGWQNIGSCQTGERSSLFGLRLALGFHSAAHCLGIDD